MREVLQKAAEQFREYERIHKAKGTPDANVKAATNAAYALECEAAVSMLDATSSPVLIAREAVTERFRQVVVEGYEPAGDDRYEGGEIARAAACYAVAEPHPVQGKNGRDAPPFFWPWSSQFWRPTTHRRNCIKAIALLIAEVERLDRKAAKP